MERFCHDVIEGWRENLGHVSKSGKLHHQWSTSTTSTPAEPKELKRTPVPAPTSLWKWWDETETFEQRGAVEHLQKIEKDRGRLIMMNFSTPFSMQDKRMLKFRRVHYLTQEDFERYAYGAIQDAVRRGRPVLMPSMNCHGPLAAQSVQPLFTDIDVKLAGEIPFSKVLEIERRCARAVEALFQTLWMALWPEDKEKDEEGWRRIHWGFLRVKEVRKDKDKNGKNGEREGIWRIGYHIYSSVVLPVEQISLVMMILRNVFVQGFEEMVLTEQEYREWQQHFDGGRRKAMAFALDDVITTGLRFPNSFKIVDKSFFGGFYEMDATVSLEEYMRRWRTVMLVATASMADVLDVPWGTEARAVEQDIERQPLRAGLTTSKAIPIEEKHMTPGEKRLMEVIQHSWEMWLTKASPIAKLRHSRKEKVRAATDFLFQAFQAVDWSHVYGTKYGSNTFIVKFAPRTPCMFCVHQSMIKTDPVKSLYYHNSEHNTNFLWINLKSDFEVTIMLFCYSPSCKFVSLTDIENETEKVKYKRPMMIEEMKGKLKEGEKRHFSVSIPVCMTGRIDYPVFGFAPEEGTKPERTQGKREEEIEKKLRNEVLTKLDSEEARKRHRENFRPPDLSRMLVKRAKLK